MCVQQEERSKRVRFGPSSFKIRVNSTFSFKLKELSIESIVADIINGSELPWTPPFSVGVAA